MTKKAVIAYEGKATGDGRTILPGALYWDDLPLPVFYFEGRKETGFRNVVGKIVELERSEFFVFGEVIASLNIEMPEGYILALDGVDAEISYKFEPLEVLFLKMRVAGGTLIPQEKWAWQV